MSLDPSASDATTPLGPGGVTAPPVSGIPSAARTLPSTAGPAEAGARGPAAAILASIGKYRIVRVIAETHLSIVYHAEDTVLPRQVALKLPRGVDLSSASAQARLRDEIALAARLDQQSVVPILESGEHEGVPYFVMPLLHGLNVDEHVQSVALELDERITLFRKLCEIVALLHKDGVLHLDLKPGNFIIDRHGAPRLLDFGLATTREVLAKDVTRTAGGTLRYMAPEQTFPSRQHELTPAADVYALGIIFYKLLTGSFPYSVEGSTESVLETIRRAAPRPPSAVNEQVPSSLNRLVLRALDKDPRARFQDAHAFGCELDAIAPRTGGPVKRRGIPTLAIGGAVVLLAGVGLLGYGALSSEPTPEIAPSLSAGSPAPRTAPDPIVRKYSPGDLAALAGPMAAVNAVPEALWGLYRQTQRDLENSDALRLSGAVIVDVRHLPKGGTIRWQTLPDTALPSEVPFANGDAIVVFLPAGHTYRIECLYLGRTTELRAPVAVGRLSYWQPTLGTAPAGTNAGESPR